MGRSDTLVSHSSTSLSPSPCSDSWGSPNESGFPRSGLTVTEHVFCRPCTRDTVRGTGDVDGPVRTRGHSLSSPVYEGRDHNTDIRRKTRVGVSEDTTHPGVCPVSPETTRGPLHTHRSSGPRSNPTVRLTYRLDLTFTASVPVDLPPTTGPHYVLPPSLFLFSFFDSTPTGPRSRTIPSRQSPRRPSTVSPYSVWGGGVGVDPCFRVTLNRIR